MALSKRLLTWTMLFCLACGLSRPISAAEISASAQKKYADAQILLDGEGNENGAIKLLEEAVAIAPEYMDAHLLLGKLYSNRITLFDKAPLALVTVIELADNPQMRIALEARYYLGIIFLKIGDYDKSIEAFRKVIELDNDSPHLPEIYNYLGVAYYHKDTYQESITNFKKAIQLNPVELKVTKFNLKSVYKRMEHYNLGMTYFFMKDFDAAIIEMLTAVEVDSNYFDALFHLGDIYLNKGMPGEALRSFQRALRVNPNHKDIAQVYNGLGVTLYKKGQTGQGIEMLRKALVVRPNYGQAKKNLRNILAGMKEETLIKADPQNNKEQYLEEAINLANTYVMIGLYEKGINLYQQIMQIDIENESVFEKLVAAYRTMSDDYYEQEDYKHAVTGYKRIIELSGKDMELTYKLGMSYYHQGKYWYNDAIEALTQVIDYKDSRYFLGLISFNRHEFVEASFYIEEILKINESDHVSHYLLGKAYKGLGKVNDAVDEVKRAIELAPDNQEYQDYLQELSARPASSPSGGRGDVNEETPVNPMDSVDILNEKGVRYVQTNLFDRAEANFLAGLNKDPGHVPLRNNYALLLMMKNDLDEAEKELLTAGLLKPMDARILINLAILYHNKKIYELAKENLDKARRVKKELSNLYNILGEPDADISSVSPVWIKTDPR